MMRPPFLSNSTMSSVASEDSLSSVLSAFTTSSTTSVSEGGCQVTRWIIDTRSIWQGERIQDVAAEYLAIISEEERTNILRKYFIADARMALASALLKRAYIAMVTGLPWSQIQFSRKGHHIHGKPCWNPPETPTPGYPWPTVDFNVSHQAGLVTLIGVYLPDPVIGTLQQDYIAVGCDIVAPNERSDLVTISASDFEEYTSTYSEIFSPEELWDMTYNLPSNSVSLLNGERLSADVLGRHDRLIVMDQVCEIRMPDGRVEEIGSEVIIDAKLRRFYTFFCLKEAYIKLVGEGLLAPWIKDCEFKNVRAPTPGNPIRCSTDAAWGGKVHGGRIPDRLTFLDQNDALLMAEEDLEIWFEGEEVQDVRTEVQSYGESFMISSMIRPATLLGPAGEFPDWHRVNLETDILDVARRDPKAYL
ncbi:uncharacterized protein PV09_05583 [Verruconis gallopava]|uniref:holo-[acyl-carrier-protein] synthase n=1 Tax=Verruconis gallopava TaxID=253628 RepID=A0A0D2A9U3_9PEZI|nr:uncharacterized protein PV09_05583 [Verruconis gallopava]KIW03375.1 hypothetical protein PV09_05583 [Verruconis gallopava]